MGKNMNLLKLNFIVIIILIIIIGFTGDFLYSSGITVHSSSELIEKFETLYIKIDLTQPFTNPYDPKDIKVDVVIELPQKKILRLPCFYNAGSSENSKWFYFKIIIKILKDC